MLLWFVVVAPIVVAEVFRSPMVDYRLVVLGALLPLTEAVYGVPLFLHTLIGPVATLALVMALTVNRRLVRRRLLGVPIGMMLHLVLDATWARSALFWWPAFGWSLQDEAVPEAGRGLIVGVVLELLAIGLGYWAWRRYELDDADNRRRLLRTGHLSRAAVGLR